MRQVKPLILAIAVTLASGSVFAFGPGDNAGPRDCPKAGMKKGMKGHSPMRLLAKLDLSDAQKDQIKAIFEEAKATKETQRSDHKAKMEAFLTAEYDSEEAKALQAERKAHHQAAQANKLEIKHKIYQILTPEQREKAKEMRKNAPKFKKGKRGGQGFGNAIINLR